MLLMKTHLKPKYKNKNEKYSAAHEQYDADGSRVWSSAAVHK